MVCLLGKDKFGQDADERVYLPQITLIIRTERELYQSPPPPDEPESDELEPDEESLDPPPLPLDHESLAPEPP
jgi:hypothetical protein